MALDAYTDKVQELQGAPEVEVEGLPRAWANAWYKAGWRDCLRMVRRQLISLAGEKHAPRTVKQLETVFRLMVDHRWEMMEQATQDARDYSGFVRWNVTLKDWEWFHPISQGEAYEAITWTWGCR
jgi:hypothetical protein